VPALLARRLDKVHPTGLVNMPVVFAAVEFRQQDVEGLQKRRQLLEYARQEIWKKNFMTRIWVRQSVGEFTLGYDPGRLVSGDRSAAGAVAGGEGLFNKDTQ
jgi:hypothetical protein